MKCEIIIPEEIYRQLYAHLFPGDHDEHGAVITTGINRYSGGIKLIARELYLAKDGTDYIPGESGYRMLHANFVRDKILYCSKQQLCYLAVHNHQGQNNVRFSRVDLASHERGYPALLDINSPNPVGALVFAENAVAGDIWLSQDKRITLNQAIIIGANINRLYPSPPPHPAIDNALLDRQIRIFGEVGGRILGDLTIGVIGAGGVSSLIMLLLAGLNIGKLIYADDDYLLKHNRPRIPYAMRYQTGEWLEWIGLGRYADKFAISKIAAATRYLRKYHPNIQLKPLFGNICDPDVADAFKECDFLFLGADSMQARLLFNALVFQYGIPGYQVGSKIQHDSDTGMIQDIFSVVRPVGLTQGCLLCNGLIDPYQLQIEAMSNNERRAQRYIDEPDIPAPSVITLNARGASHAVDEFMLRATGLFAGKNGNRYMRFHPQRQEYGFDIPRKDPLCPVCGVLETSIRAKGDSVRLPVRKK